MQRRLKASGDTTANARNGPYRSNAYVARGVLQGLVQQTAGSFIDDLSQPVDHRHA